MAMLDRFALGINLAARNLGRHQRRTLQTLAVLIIGLAALTLLDGYITYQLHGLEYLIIRSGTGDLEAEVSPQAFDEADNDPFSYLIPNSAEIVHQLRKNPAVDDALEAFPFFGVVSTLNDRSTTVRALALPTNQAQKMLSARNIVAGNDLPSSPSGQILLGSGVADKLGVHPGDSVILYALAAGGGVNEDTFKVAGVESSGISVTDSSSAFVDLADAQRLTGAENVPQILVFLNNHDDATRLQTLWSAHPPRGQPHLVWKRWDQLSPFWQQGSTSLLMVLGVARLIVLIIAMFSVAGTLTLAVMERLREVGTLRAFGTPKGAVALQFLIEGVLLGLIGSLVGIFLGWGLCEVFNLAGGIVISAPGMAQPIDVLFTPTTIHFAQNVVFVVLSAALGSWLPGAWAARRPTAILLRSV